MTLRSLAPINKYLSVFATLKDNVKQLSKLLLTVYQFSSVRIPIEYGGRVTRCSISCFVTAGLWPRSGYRGGSVSESKGNASGYREDRVKVIVIAGWLSTGCHCTIYSKHSTGVL